MFQKNDKFLFAARVIFIAVTVIGVFASIILPIRYAIAMKNGFYALYMIAYLLGCLIFCVFWNLLLSFLVDVKLIRNKLYKEDNATLSTFIDDVDNETENPPEEDKNQTATENGKGLGYTDAKDMYDE